MMKKLTALFLTLILCLALFPAALAAEPEFQIIRETTEILPDGTEVRVVLSEQTVRTRGRVYSKIGKKDYSYGSDWVFTVYGTFSINEGVSATCTADSYAVSIANSAWAQQAASSGHGGNTAYASGTMSRYALGAIVQNIYPSVSVSCDANGNLS